MQKFQLIAFKLGLITESKVVFKDRCHFIVKFNCFNFFLLGVDVVVVVVVDFKLTSLRMWLKSMSFYVVHYIVYLGMQLLLMSFNLRKWKQIKRRKLSENSVNEMCWLINRQLIIIIKICAHAAPSFSHYFDSFLLPYIHIVTHY